MPAPASYRVVEVRSDGSHFVVQDGVSEGDAQRLRWLISGIAPRKAFQVEADPEGVVEHAAVPPPRFTTFRRAGRGGLLA